MRSRAPAAALGAALLLACGGEEVPVIDGAVVERIHRDAIVVDTHSDTTPRFEDPSWDFSERHEGGHMDLPRIREGGLDVQFWSIYMGAKEHPGEAVREALVRIDSVWQMAARYPDDVAVATSVAEIRAVVGQGKLASLMGVEGGHIIEDSLAILRSYYRLGVRYMTLTHSFNTNWADSSGTFEVPEPLNGGLTDFGRRVVLEMNRLGMMVDVSHVSDATFFDTLEVARAPVIASHSSCRSVAEHPRNMTNEMLRALADNGGVVMINFYPAYIDERAAAGTLEYFARWKGLLDELNERYADDPLARMAAMRSHFAEYPVPQTSLSVLLDHFDEALEVAGPDHVGIGADWDGVPSMPVGMEDVSRLPAITRGLLERGHSPETIRKVLGENLLRVMSEVEAVAANWDQSD